jgi:hypothetical protein
VNTSNQAWLKSAIRRWVVWLLLATLFAIACVMLSNWQLSRRDEAVARINLVIANYDLNPVSIEEFAREDEFTTDMEWRPVEVVGRYLTDASFLVRNRPYAGAPGFIQLAAFESNSGTVYAVDRGWLPTGSSQDSPDLIPQLPSGELTLTARIRPTEPTFNRAAPAGQLATVNSAAMAQQLDEPAAVAESFYLRMFRESVPSENYPTLMAKPKLDEGNHLSYAIQWVVFGAMAFAALFWAIRQERLAMRALADPNFVRKSRKQVGDEDKAFEDSL